MFSYRYLNAAPFAGGVWKIHVELPDQYPYKSPSIGECVHRHVLDDSNTRFNALMPLDDQYQAFAIGSSILISTSCPEVSV